MDAEFILVRRSLEGSIKELPPLPNAVLRILETMSGPDPSAGAVEEIVAADQALTAKVLRVVNSAYYGLARQISNVGQAVVILGLQQVRNVALAVGASSTFKGGSPRQAEVMGQFWTHSFATSATATLLAGQRGLDRKTCGELGTIGLVHDIGRLFFFANFPKTFDRLILLALERGMSFDEAERNLMGVSHAGLGGDIADRWGFPPAFAEAIRGHEGPFGQGESDAAKIVHMADWLNKSAYTLLDGLAPAALDPKVRGFFALSEEDFECVRERTEVLVLEARESVGVMAA